MVGHPIDNPELPDLFDPLIPNNPALWAVFLKRHSGKALVDNPKHPRQGVVHSAAALTYASQGISQEFLTKAINRFRRSREVWLVRNQGDPPAPAGYHVNPRLEFYGYDRHSKVLSDLRVRLPTKFDIRRIDQDLIKRCEWQEAMAFYCGSVRNFLRHDLGLCLMKGDEIIVEAYASALGHPFAEIGAITHEAYRGRGYAPIAVAHLIEALEQLGYHGYWSCDVDNLASARVARKLDFKIEKAYEIWEYSRQQDATGEENGGKATSSRLEKIQG
jgi:GNAT superfamily N-acetyltransferase